MADNPPRRQPRSGRARKRAIRAQAAQAGVPYSVAARQLEAAGLRPGETLATHGRTIYPTKLDAHRRSLVLCRFRRSFDERVRDTRQAALLPSGRAAHLVERFPPTRGAAGTGVGPLYSGEGRAELLAMLYLVVAHEAPGLLPTVGELTWIAEMGEETALDTACADLDRTVRRLLDWNRAGLWTRIETALAAGEVSDDWTLRHEAGRLAALYRTMRAPGGRDGIAPGGAGPSLEGVRQILDALLIVADDGHAPGTRVRLLAHPAHRGRCGTIVGVLWGSAGPPMVYEVKIDGAGAPTVSAVPQDLAVLAGQDAHP